MFRRSLIRFTPLAGKACTRAVIATPLRTSVLSSRAFSVCQPALKSNLNAADSQLISALKSEIEIENSDASKETNARPAGLDKFLSETGFELVEKDGQDDVELVKKNGGETVHVFFSVSDVTNSEAESPEIDPEEGMEEHNDLTDETVVRVNIIVEKPSGKALGIEAIAQDDFILVESVIPYESNELALSEAAEADYKRRALYQGPPFAFLDENVQTAVDAFLEARDINDDLAHFIIEYASYRENQEYIRWLENVKDVVEA